MLRLLRNVPLMLRFFKAKCNIILVVSNGI